MLKQTTNFSKNIFPLDEVKSSIMSSDKFRIWADVATFKI